MSEKRLYDVIDKEEPRGQSVSYQGIPCTARHCCTNLNRLTEENEQLKVLLKEAEDEIERLKKTKQGLLESIVENDSNNAMILEFISNVRESEMCEGCKHKDKPVEWYLENGLSITNGVCDRYEPED